MFESAELGHKIDKATYDAEVPKLREALLEAQVDLAKLAKFPVIMLMGGSASARMNNSNVSGSANRSASSVSGS